MKMRSKYCGSMPMPLSRTSIWYSEFLSETANVDSRHGVRAELERVADQVLEQLAELHLVAVHRGQRVVGHRGARLLDAGAQVEERAAQRRLERHRLELLALGADARVGEQVLDQLLHARRAVDDVGHELARVLVELRSP